MTDDKNEADAAKDSVLRALGVDPDEYAKVMDNQRAIGFEPFNRERAEAYEAEVIGTLGEIAEVAKSAIDRVKIKQYPAAIEAIGAATLGLGMAEYKLQRLILESLGTGLAKAIVGANQMQVMPLGDMVPPPSQDDAPKSKAGDGYL